jgi:hypothetical protein
VKNLLIFDFLGKSQNTDVAEFHQIVELRHVVV